MNTFTTSTPTKMIFGAGCLAELATTPFEFTATKALIVISAGTSMRKFGYLQRVEELLASRNIATVVYDKILPNPIKEHVMEAAALCKSEGCDFVIGLGGGSSIDSAKSIALMACNDGDYWDYISGGTGKGQPAVGGVLPLVAIPTTAGTGTEVDPWTVVTHNEEKIGFGIPETFPKVAYVDPELMVSVPAKLTAYQGFDAFFHAAEGYIAKCATPISELYSLKSIELLTISLPDAVEDGSNIDARADVALASSLAGLVESTSCCTSEHSMEHAMSAYFPELPHGAGLIAISKAYFSCFKESAGERLMEMAEVMTGEFAEDPQDFIDALGMLQKACGVDDIKLSDYGITEADLPRFVQNARATMGGLFAVDPHDLTDEDVLGIYQKSFK